MAALVYAMCSLLLLYGVFKRTIDAHDGGALVLGMLATSLFFYGALRSGWNQRFGDPSLTVAQILVGLCWSCLGYAIANEGHGGVLVPFFMVLVVGVFNMSRTQAIGVSVCALLGMGSVMLYKAATAPDVYRPHIQAAFFVMLTTIVPLIAAWAGTVSQMRKRIMEQKLQLASAMQRFAAHGELPVLAGDGAAREMGELWQQFADLARHRRELDERRSTMLAAISHDLRSPLTRIRMAAELLPKAEDVEVRRELIVRNIDVANRLLSNFIDMARADHEPIEDRVDLRALVLDVALSAPEVRLGELPAKPQWLAPASAVALERALLNLIDNARVYGAPPVEMGLSCGATSVLWVRDHGPGVDPSQHALVLQPFTRGESNRLRPGTGLGLAIVHRTTTRHGGRVALRNAGPGLCVELHLPSFEVGQ